MSRNELPVDLASLPPDGGDEFNRLIFEKSPYLLQHARNPLDWYPWCDEAFARAQSEDKPVFLSIGYSTCHWCHVMEKEAFEDEEVADFLNRHFISIKVDREERPDIDATYMNICQMMTGSGGWPLNLALTPEKHAFFATTYLPKHGRGGMAGLLDIARKIIDLWHDERGRLTQTADQVNEALQRLEQPAPSEEGLDPKLLDTACKQFLSSYDQRHAGFGDAPKFPAAHNLSLLLRIAARKDEEKARVMALQTLQQMRLGGIYDQLGFGIHRYSVDARWRVPHFEKMLYDQAMAAMAFLEGYQASGDPFFAQAAQEILEYVGRDLSDPQGGFYCGEDADSEGREGTFYIWDKKQILEILGDQDGALFCRIFGVTQAGNFEGSNILHLDQSLEDISAAEGIDLQELVDRLGQWRRVLFQEREKRPRPHRDEKILTGWNGLMIGAFARAGANLAQPELTLRARRAADFVLSQLRNNAGRLLRRYCDGEAGIPAFLEDYAFFAFGLTELFLATQEADYMECALNLTEEMIQLFAAGSGTFYDTGSDSETVLVRAHSTFDGALPSGNSLAALNLLRLGRLHGDTAMEARGEETLCALAAQARKYPQGHSQLLIALDFALGPVDEVVLVPVADQKEEIFREILRGGFRPRTLNLEKDPDRPELEQFIPSLKEKQSVDGESTVYLCRDRACREPITDPEELKKVLAEKWK